MSFGSFCVSMNHDPHAQAQLTSLRPYRSHKFSACSPCRKRKSRCTVDTPGQACLVCRLNRSECDITNRIDRKSLSQQDSTEIEASRGLSAKRRKTGSSQSKKRPPPPPPPPAAHDLATTIATLDETDLRSSHIVGPASATDAQELEQYASLVSKNKGRVIRIRENPYSIYSRDLNKPVLYYGTSKVHGNLPRRLAPGIDECEMLERLLEPFTEDLVNLYFEHINPCFPLLDGTSFLKLYRNERAKLPPALLCDLYAASVLLWNQSSYLKQHRPPNQRYCWSLAVQALNGDFLCAGLSTIIASLLALGGRPISTTTGNVTTIGRTVGLAHSLGLNRDPSDWKLRDVERRVRIRLWWTILIHDWWASLAHGTPPHISPTQFDTPLPKGPDSSSQTVPSNYETVSDSFIALCSLTRILGQALQLIYDLKQPHNQENQDSLQALQRELSTWLSNHLNLFPSSDNNHQKTQGFQNLRISYLTLNQLLTRLKLDNLLRRSPVDISKLHTLQISSLEAASAVVDFVTNATVDDLNAFWLPYTAYHLTAICILLLRLSLAKSHAPQMFSEPPIERDLPTSALSQVSKLLTFLRSARDDHKWDLADMCLAQCEPYYQYRIRKGPIATHAPEASDTNMPTQAVPRSTHESTTTARNKTWKATVLADVSDESPGIHSPTQRNDFADSYLIDNGDGGVGTAGHTNGFENWSSLDTDFHLYFPDTNLGFEMTGTEALFPDLWAWDGEEIGAGSGIGT